MFNMDPKSAALKNAMAKRRYNTVLGCLESFQAAETTIFYNSPKNLRIPWPSEKAVRLELSK